MRSNDGFHFLVKVEYISLKTDKINDMDPISRQKSMEEEKPVVK